MSARDRRRVIEPEISPLERESMRRAAVRIEGPPEEFYTGYRETAVGPTPRSFEARGERTLDICEKLSDLISKERRRHADFEQRCSIAVDAFRRMRPSPERIRQAEITQEVCQRAQNSAVRVDRLEGQYVRRGCATLEELGVFRPPTPRR